MLKKKQVLTIMSIAVVSFLLGTAFNFTTVVTGDGGSPWDNVWTVISELQSTVDTLEARVEMLESQSGLTAPDYDSGWIIMPFGKNLILTHNLNTPEVFVYVTGYTEQGFAYGFDGINQIAYGGLGSWGDGIFWFKLTDSTIQLYRDANDDSYDQVRIQIWKISEPPT